MDDDYIPPAMGIAADVSEAEYRKAKCQVIIVWVGTAIAVGTMLFVKSLDVPWVRLIPGLLAFAVFGVGAHFLLHLIFPEARKMSTMRMRKYKELRALRAGRAKLREGRGPRVSR